MIVLIIPNLRGCSYQKKNWMRADCYVKEQQIRDIPQIGGIVFLRANSFQVFFAAHSNYSMNDQPCRINRFLPAFDGLSKGIVIVSPV